MIYIHQNKATQELKAFGSIVKLCRAMDLKKDPLYYHFGRKKLKVFDRPKFRITRIEGFRAG